ncbi:hypothetical protein ACX0HA_10215 [Flavobacterium hauense]
MKLHLLRSALLALTLIFAGCSVDDEEYADTNGFTIDSTFHPTAVVYIDALDVHENPDGSVEDAISITLATADYHLNGAVIDPLDYVMLKLKMTDLQAVPNIPLANYYVGVDAYNNGGTPQDAITMLWQYSSNSNLTAVEKNVTINYVSASEIDLTYTFKRMDGKLIYGSYVGPYIPLQH